MAKATNSPKNITHTEVRMYTMGTGDCFIIKFFSKKTLCFKMMIDCGTWQGQKPELIPYIQDLKAYVNNSIDLLVITHEHKDHVYVFEACEELFTNDFEVKDIWMAWTENEEDAKASQWLKDFGDKKKALAIATNQIKQDLQNPLHTQQLASEHNGSHILEAKQQFAGVLSNFADLQFALKNGEYVGMLGGMKVVKEKMAKDIKIRYCKPGDIIKNLQGAYGIKFYILGPPLVWDDIKKESGGKGESYDHNKLLAKSDAFAAAINSLESDNSNNIMPFDRAYTMRTEPLEPIQAMYNRPENAWRNIDYDWLNSAGTLALRVNSMTNNLSLAMAIEFESGRVMLFPGDAEYGSWASWQNIKWAEKPKDNQKTLTEKLLNSTIFYKVAHHLSHNGTAERVGMKMMTNPDLTAMATLDYHIISSGWKGTMPNQGLLADMLAQTKGRLIVMNEDGPLYQGKPLANGIAKARESMSQQEATVFEKAFLKDDANNLFKQFTVSAT